MMFSLFLFMIVGVFSDLKLTINHQDLFMHFDDNPPQTIGELIEAIKRQIAMDSSFGFNIDDDPTWKFWVPSKQNTDDITIDGKLHQLVYWGFILVFKNIVVQYLFIIIVVFLVF
eukprot:196091_1